MKYYSNKHSFSPFAIYPKPTSTRIMMHMLYFGGSDLNKNFNLFISTFKQSSVRARVCDQMARRDMNYRV